MDKEWVVSKLLKLEYSNGTESLRLTVENFSLMHLYIFLFFFLILSGFDWLSSETQKATDLAKRE